MEYISTRGQAPARDFEGVLLAGLAEDGGLFVPRHWPELSPAEWRAMRGLTQIA
jgi:threonine synthase